MNYITLENKTETAIFDTPYFMKIQYEIYKKYEVDGLSYINNINNYFLHIMEEIWEVKFAKTRDERLGELIDVLMYIGSTVNCFDGVDDKTLYMLKREKMRISTKYVDSDEVYNVNDILIGLRREYPERKWHKQYDANKIDHIDRSNKTSVALSKAITFTIRSMLADYSIDEINKALEEKETYILSLK